MGNETEIDLMAQLVDCCFKRAHRYTVSQHSAPKSVYESAYLPKIKDKRGSKDVSWCSACRDLVI